MCSLSLIDDDIITSVFQTFPTIEDAEKFSKDKKVKIDEDVERVRRAHLNDIENIPAFITVAFFYMLTQPDEILAINLIRIAAIARIVHTYAYVFLQKHQPRGIAWALCFGVTMFMGVNVLCAFT